MSDVASWLQDLRLGPFATLFQDNLVDDQLLPMRAERRQIEAMSVEIVDSTALWGERGRAHDLLAPVHGWFIDGFDTPDLVAAKALLENVR